MPHFGLGLGIGIVDAALVPLLAKFVDDILFHEEPTSFNQVNPILRYGNVYAIQQTSVSLAYFLAPLIGGELAQAIGFDYLMRTIGAFNIIYGSVLLYSYQLFDPKVKIIHTYSCSFFLNNIFSCYVRSKMKCF